MLAGVGESSHARGHAEELLDARARGSHRGRAKADGDAAMRRAVKLRRRRAARPVDVHGPARVDRRTKDLIRRLNAGDIAVIDHRDIDRVAADTLVAAGCRRGREREPVDLGPLPERRPDPDRARPASRCSTRSAPTSWTRSTTARCSSSTTARSGATTRSSRSASCSSPTRSKRGWKRRAARSAPSCSRSPRNTLAYIETEAQITFEPLAAAAAAREDHAAATRSWSCAATTTSTTSRRCARTSASTSRC